MKLSSLQVNFVAFIANKNNFSIIIDKIDDFTLWLSSNSLPIFSKNLFAA